jgi:ADP-ribose pyrophosphatase YjhB (NUDIX family)
MYCPRCAAALAAAPPTTCTGCGAELWRNAKPCAGALVARDGRVLLVRRAAEPWKGCWDIPGGFCDAEEHPLATAAREVREEAGLDIEITGFLGVWLDDYGESIFPGQLELTFNVYYHAVPRPGAVAVAAHETTEIGWFAPHELPENLAFPKTARSVLAAWSEAIVRGDTRTVLRDRGGTG